MTDTSDTSAETIDPQTAEYAELDPHSLVFADNVRDHVDLSTDPEFVASIREHGVMLPVTATRTTDGTVTVEDGQRRVLAAREVGLPTVPVLIRVPTGTGKAQQVERIARQLVANDRREAITTGQRAAAIATMLDLGASVTKIAKTTQLDRDTIKFAAKAGTSNSARTALDTGQLDLEQAAIIGAFEAEGDTDAVERLLAASPFQFRHLAQAISNERIEARARAAAAAPWIEGGHPILHTQPETWRHDCDWYATEELETLDGDEVTDTVTAAHPALWSVWLTRADEYQVLDRDTGTDIPADSVDWDTEDNPDTEPADGLRHFQSVEVREQWVADYYTRAADLDAAGVRLTKIAAAVRHPVPADTTSDGVVEGGEAAVAAAELAEAQRREADKAERRQVIACNKLGAAALDVRRDWLRTVLLARKTAPKQAAAFVAEMLARDPYLIGENKAQGTALILLGLDHREALQQAIAAASPSRAQVFGFAIVLGALENRCTKDAWRGRRHVDTRGLTEYLKLLAELGYTLSPIEAVITGNRHIDDLDNAD